MFPRCVMTAGAALLLVGGTSAVASTFGAFEGGVELTDNVTRAVFEDDREREQFVYADSTGGWRFQPGKNQSLFLAGHLRVAFALQAEELTHYAPAVTLRWRAKTRLGADAPRWGGEVRAEWLGFESDVRRGWLYSARLGYAAPIGQRLRVWADALASHRHADSEAFSQDALAAELGVEWQLSGRWLAYAGYGYRDGDVTSTATPAAIDPRVQPILDRSTALVPDDAFPGKIAYRLDARTQHVQVGANVALTTKGALDLRYRFEHTDAGGGIDYEVNVVRIAWLQSF